MAGGCALMESHHGEIDVFAFPVFVRYSKGERKTSFLGPYGLLGTWDSTTNGVEHVLIPTLLTYMEPGKEFASPLFSWSDSGTFKILMTGREVHNSVTEDRLPDGADNWWHSERKKKLFLLLGEEESVAYSREDHNGRRNHRITHKKEQCYIPLWARERKQWVDYDMATRKKLADGTCDSWNCLMIASYERTKGGVDGFDRIQWSVLGETWPKIFCYKSDEKKGAEFSVLMIPIWHNEE